MWLAPQPRPIVRHAVSFGVTRAVRDLPPRRVSARTLFGDPRQVRNPSLAYRELEMELPIKRQVKPRGSPDAALHAPAAPAAAVPPPLGSFEGLSNAENGALFGGYVAPPDTNGDVGPAHYVQAVNTVVRVYDREGAPLSEPFLMSDLFGDVGGPCSFYDDGDPVVAYDHLADRWILTQFALPSFPFEPFY